MHTPGTNGIAPECLTDAEARRCLSRHSMTVEGLTRTRSGAWVVVVEIEAGFYLPDGRRVEVRQSVALRGRQVGRKPRRPETTPRRKGEAP